MDFYVISPVSNLEPMRLGNRIFVLAHLWIKYPHYREFILEQKRLGKWITLDNSAAERALVTEDILIGVCKELMPNEVIAPDVLFDKGETIVNALLFKIRMEKEGLLDKIEIFFCPQGSDQNQWLAAYNWALSRDWIKTIGLSKIAVPRAWLNGPADDQGIKEARHKCYDYLIEHWLLEKPIHCLGMGDPTEFEYYHHPNMRSTDSVFPVLAASLGQDFYKDSSTRLATPHDFLETYDMSKIDVNLIKTNVTFLKECCATPYTDQSWKAGFP